MRRTKSFLYNSTSSALLQIVTFIVGLITPRVMLTAYGSEVNGMVSSITQFITYFNLVEAGLSVATVYALYKPLAQQDHASVNGIVSAAKKFYTQSGWIFLLLTSVLALVYPMYISSESLTGLEIGVLVLILGVNGALEFFTLSKYRALLTADQKTYVISLASMMQIVVNTTILCVMALSDVNVVLTKFVALFSIFLRSFVLMLYCKKNYRYLDYQVQPDTKALNKRWDALYMNILGAVQVGAPSVLITLVLKDLKLVSVYSVFNMVIAGLNGVLSIFTSGTSASFGNVIALGQSDTLKKTYQEFEYIYYITITIIYTVAFLTIMPFVNIYTTNITDINYNRPLLGILFVVNGLLYNIKTPQGMMVISAGLYKETRGQVSVQVLIAIFASLALAPKFGIEGIMVGNILSNVYRTVVLLFFIPHHVTKTKVFDSLRRMVRIFLCAAVAVLPLRSITYCPDTFGMWVIYALQISAWVCVVTVLVNYVFDRQEFKNVLRRFKMLGKGV